MSGDADRRAHKRVALDTLCALILADGKKYPAMARNISARGLFVECERPLQKGDQLLLSLNLQYSGRLRKFEADSEVIHGPVRVSMTAFGYGLRFMELGEEAASLVQDYVDARPEI